MQDYLSGEKDPLSDPLIRSYYQANLDLVRTIGIKSTRSALEQNKSLINQFDNVIIDNTEPATWKYYLNISGEYYQPVVKDILGATWYAGMGLPEDNPDVHLAANNDNYLDNASGFIYTLNSGVWIRAADTVTVPASWDKLMTVISLDTLLPITFNKQSLAVNLNTKTEYQFGTRYYRTLISQYPDQIDLIMGILMPCDIQTAIDAEDGAILRYDTSLVEENEYSLIKELEDAIKRHIARVYIDAYSATDSYFLMAYYNALYLFILPKLFNLRDARRNTYEAHSFHVRMFLRGYMGLDKYYSFLTQKQAMYLYRNLLRIVKSMGYDSQFNELVENLMTPRNIRLLGYNVRQTNDIDDDLTPITVVKSEGLNDVHTSPDEETLTFSQLFDKEQSVLYGTKDYYDAFANRVIATAKRQDQFKVITKDITAQIQETVNIFSLTFGDIALTHWGYMAATGLYTADISFINPRTTAQQTLNAKQAFIYMYYLSLTYVSEGLASDLILNLSPEQIAQLVKLQEILAAHKVTRIPSFFARRHASVDALTATALLTLVDNDYKPKMTPTAEYLMSTRVTLSGTNANNLFYSLCLNIYNSYIKQHGSANLMTDHVKRGFARNMVYYMYQDSMVDLDTTGMSIETFLSSNNLDSYETLGSKYIAEIISNLYLAGTGLDANLSGNKKNVAQALISIMRALTSYNIQYIEMIAETDLTSVQAEPCNISGYISDDSFITNLANLPVGIGVQDVTATQLVV